jgi:Zn-dependent protease with chaperone function
MLFTIPRLVITVLLANCIVQIIINAVELSHQSSVPPASFTRLINFYYHQFTLDELRLTIFDQFLSFFVIVILFASLSRLWSWAKGGITLGILAVFAKSVFMGIPMQYMRSCVILAKYGQGETFSSVLSTVLTQFFANTIDFLLTLGGYWLISRCTRFPTADEGDNQHHMCDFWILMTTFQIGFAITQQYTAADTYFATIDPEKILQIQRAPVNDSIKSGVHKLVTAQSFPYENVYVDYSTDDVNAMYMGIAKERVVVQHRLIPLLNLEQLVGVLAHELGHWKHSHTIIMLIVALMEVMLHGFAIRLASKGDLGQLGFEGNVRPIALVVLIVEILMTGFIVVDAPTANSISRIVEVDADCFAHSRGYAIGRSLTRLGELAAKQLDATSWYEMFYLSHPEISRRLAHLQKCPVSSGGS